MIRTLFTLALLILFVIGCQPDSAQPPATDEPTPDEATTETSMEEPLQATAISLYTDCIEAAESIKGQNPQLEECYSTLNRGLAYLEQNPPHYMQASEILNLLYNSNEEAAKDARDSSEFFHLIYINGEDLHSLIMEGLSTWVLRMQNLEEGQNEFFRSEIFPRFAGQSDFARSSMLELSLTVGEEAFFNSQVDSLYTDWEE